MICRVCKDSKDEENFPRKKKRPDGSILRATICKPCQRTVSKKHYYENKEVYFSKNKKKEIELKEFLKEHKEKCKCTRCGLSGEGITESMDFRTKETEIMKRSVSYLVKHSKKILLEGIAKCDIYCANCQRIVDAEVKHGIKTPKKQ